MDTTDKCPICGKSHKIIQSDGYYTIFCCSENRCYCLYDWLFDCKFVNEILIVFQKNFRKCGKSLF